MINNPTKYIAAVVIFCCICTAKAQEIISFTLINAENDTEIGVLANTNSFVLADLPSNQLSIRANTSGAIGSIVFKLNGETVQTENSAPYAFLGNSGADYFPWVPELGTYQISGAAYSARNGQGTLFDTDPITVTFTDETVTDPDPDPTGPAIQSFVLINARYWHNYRRKHD